MRIIAHMVVGPGEADRFLATVLERVSDWADIVHVALDLVATDNEDMASRKAADYVTRLSTTFVEHEGRFREEAWHQMEDVVQPELGDYIVCIDADEIIHDAAAVRKGIKEFPGKRLGVTFHHMWNGTHYRVDGQWRPHVAYIIIPYRFQGHHADRLMASGREPTYAQNVPVHGHPVSDILHLGYLRDEDKRMKHDRYMLLDGGKFHSNAHIQSIMMTPSLERWAKGGLLD
jgi:hypothetical protein